MFEIIVDVVVGVLAVFGAGVLVGLVALGLNGFDA